MSAAARAHDRLFVRGNARPGSFVFDKHVVRVFENMISRSVPGYAHTLMLTGMLAGAYARANTRLYDLGCSLGGSLRACINSLNGRKVLCTGVDASAAMINCCASKLDKQQVSARLICSDLRDLRFEVASFVVLNWTLQFIPLADRREVVSRVYDALIPGGALLLSEKIHAEDAQVQALLEARHARFKQAQGYSRPEIDAKRRSLQGVLMTETLHTHHRRLQQAGFKQVTQVARNLNFVSLLAVKS